MKTKSTMNLMKSVLVIIAVVPVLAFAGSKKPITKTIEVRNVSGRSTPAYINIKTQANPVIYYSRNNLDLRITATGASREEDQYALSALLSNTYVNELNDGGLEIGIRDQGNYKCEIKASGSKIHKVSGECLQRVDVNFKTGPDVPIYLNGGLIRIN